MPSRYLPTLLSIAALLLLGAGQTRLAAQDGSRKIVIEGLPSDAPAQVKTPEIAGWGTATDPDHDCKFFVSEGALLISVPGAAGPHDLAAEIDTTNAPRVLQTVRGDFTLQVKIEGRFAPGEESTLSGRTGYNGAGLVVVLDPSNVVTLARAALQNPGEKEEPYANFEIRIDGEIQRFGLTGDRPLPKDGPVFLRLERRGQKFLGAVSEDGIKWHMLKPKMVPKHWPLELQVGVVAISTSKEEFNPRFSALQLLK